MTALDYLIGNDATFGLVEGDNVSLDFYTMTAEDLAQFGCVQQLLEL